jgi:hypothetical protein
MRFVLPAARESPMPRFYLHFRKGEHFFRDPEGAVFSDLEGARQEAMQSARELAAECVKHNKDIEGQFEIMDEAGESLQILTLKDTLRLKP